jgi:hypothetical protein
LGLGCAAFYNFTKTLNMARWQVNWKNLVGILFWTVISCTKQYFQSGYTGFDLVLRGAIDGTAVYLLVLLMQYIFRLLRLDQDESAA